MAHVQKPNFVFRLNGRVNLNRRVSQFNRLLAGEVCISVSNAGYTMFRGRVKVLATHSIRQFPLHFSFRASPCAITFRMRYTTADAQTSAASNRLNWTLRRFKWTRPSRRKSKSGFCVCAITFQLVSTTSLTLPAYLTANVSMKINFLSLFWSWVEGLLMLGCSPLSAGNRISPLKDLCIQTFLPITNVPWMNVDSKIYDGWLWTARNWGQQSLYRMYQKCSTTILCHHPSWDSSAKSYLLTYSMEQSSSWEANWFCS